jgi:4a-hydroxytetrahydrobiopterin dehydratase
MRPSKMDHETLEKWLGSHTGWKKATADGQDAIARQFKLADFSEALALVVRIGLAAEKADHHPDIELGFGKVRVSWSTHDAKGVTSLDTELAETTDGLAGSKKV